MYLLVEHFNRDGVCLVVTQKVYSDTKYTCAEYSMLLKCTPSPTLKILNQDEVLVTCLWCERHTPTPPSPSNPHHHGTSTLVPAIMSTSGVPLLQWSVLVRCCRVGGDGLGGEGGEGWDVRSGVGKGRVYGTGGRTVV